jgi:hypothetical protein
VPTGTGKSLKKRGFEGEGEVARPLVSRKGMDVAWPEHGSKPGPLPAGVAAADGSLA